MTLQTVSIDGSAFYLEDSILPRKYYVTVYIETFDETKDWGHNKVEPYRPYVEVLEPGITYQSGMRFNYNGITWEVRQGYTYTFDPYNPPGSSPWLGIRDISDIWKNYSTYLTGDLVTHNGVTYRVRHDGASGTEPSVTSVASGLYYEISSEWLSYNIYDGGEVVTYLGVTYISNYYSQNLNPASNSGPYQAWSVLP